LGSGLERLFGAGNISTGPEGFEALVSKPVDEKCLAIHSQNHVLEEG
jgi:hypothetical protein